MSSGGHLTSWKEIARFLGDDSTPQGNYNREDAGGLAHQDPTNSNRRRLSASIAETPHA